jgi:hypothetical protein
VSACGCDTRVMDKRSAPGRLFWEPDSTGEVCDLSGHFWASLRSTEVGERAVWSWVINRRPLQGLSTQHSALAISRHAVEL